MSTPVEGDYVWMLDEKHGRRLGLVLRVIQPNDRWVTRYYLVFKDELIPKFGEFGPHCVRQLSPLEILALEASP